MDILAALNRYVEAKEDYDGRLGEYTGYSPSYALHYWKQRLDEARADFLKSLDAIIDERIRTVLKEAENGE